LVIGCREKFFRVKAELDSQELEDGEEDEGPESEGDALSVRSGRATPSHLFQPDLKRVSIDDFEIIKPISKGAYGRVFLARKRSTGDLLLSRSVAPGLESHTVCPGCCTGAAEGGHDLRYAAVCSWVCPSCNVILTTTPTTPACCCVVLWWVLCLAWCPQVLRKVDMIRKNAVESVQAERNILASVRSPFVVRCFYSFTCRDNLYLVMEYLDGGDLSLLRMLGALEETHGPPLHRRTGKCDCSLYFCIRLFFVYFLLYYCFTSRGGP